MNRGARRAPIFADDKSCALFLDLLSELPQRFGLEIHGYALMPNHYHLMVESRHGKLSAAIGHLQARYGLALNNRYRWDGPLFRARFCSRLVTDSVHWKHLLAYLHLNPVRARLVMNLSQSRWTSHRAYLGTARHLDWLTRDELLNAFGSVSKYRAYLRQLQEKRGEVPQGFTEHVLFTGARMPRSAVQPPSTDELDSSSPTGSMDEALAVAAHRLGVEVPEIASSRPGRAGNPLRTALVWWLIQRQGQRTKDVAAALALSPSGVCQIVTRARERRAGDRVDAAIAALCQTRKKV